MNAVDDLPDLLARLNGIMSALDQAAVSYDDAEAVNTTRFGR